jgi:hypothetical protein
LVKELKSSALIGQKRVKRKRESKGLVIQIFDLYFNFNTVTTLPQELLITVVQHHQKVLVIAQLLLFLNSINIHINTRFNPKPLKSHLL